MEKENIMTVDIEDFKKSHHILDYIDDDFAIVNSLDGIPYSNDTVRLNCFLIAVCVEGCIQLDINYRTYQLQAGDLLLGLPNTLISRTMLSPKYKIRMAGLVPVIISSFFSFLHGFSMDSPVSCFVLPLYFLSMSRQLKNIRWLLP